MYKSMAWLQNTFRVGKKIWTSNDAENSRAIAGIAYALATNTDMPKFSTGMSVYNNHYHTQEDIKLMLEGTKHPDFIKTAYNELLKYIQSGIIYNRKFYSKDGWIQLSYGGHRDYGRQTVGCDFNTSGPRTFLKERKLHAYLMQCCCDNPVRRIRDIIEMDEDLDRMDDILSSMDDRDDCPEYEYIEPDYTVNFVFDKETLLANSAMAKNLAKSGRVIKGVLTTEEMQVKVDAGQTITCIRDNNAFFFSDDYCIGVNYLPQCLVSSSTVIPYDIMPREEFPDGLIKNVEEYISLHHKDKKQMNTVDELIDYLNTTYSRVTETV